MKLSEHYNSCTYLLRASTGIIDNKAVFFASTENIDNYRRLFVRDAIWIMIAVLDINDEHLKSIAKNTLEIIEKYQRADGAIPSNIASDGIVSYGTLSPKLDCSMLYILYKRLIDSKDKTKENKALMYLDQFRDNGNIISPQGGDWADEYSEEGSSLYSKVLYSLIKRDTKTLEQLAKESFGKDAFAYVLAGLNLSYIDIYEIPELLLAHYPYKDAKELKNKRIHRFRFKEFVGHYHNGGIWSWYNGLYVAVLEKNDEHENAVRILNDIMNINNKEKDNKSFYEYMSTIEDKEPNGVPYFACSAAGFIIGYNAIIKNINWKIGG